MSTKVKAIVIGTKDYKDKDKLVTLYTLDNGKMFCSMKGVRGDKAKLKSAKEIFSFGEYIIENGKGFNIISQVEIIDSFFGICQDIDKYYEGCAILDIVNKISSTESDPGLFIHLLKAIKSICYKNLPKFYVINKFLIHIFKDLGYDILTSKCSSCGAELVKKYFNLDTGEFVCPNCRNATCLIVSDACFSAVKILSETEYENLESIHLGNNILVELFKLLEVNFEWRIGQKFCTIPLN